MPKLSLQEKRLKFFESIQEALTGKTVKAFGKGTYGIWGHSDKKIDIKIKSVEFDPYNELKYNWLCLELYINKSIQYKHGLVYTNETFLKGIQTLITKAGLKGKDIAYTEQGMQRDDYVSMSMNFPKNLQVKES
jgi:hypothetical protein